MAGLYIHIPFCRQKCHYCNFFSLATQKHRKELFKSLLNELRLRKNYLKGEILETVYFGGGTPSLYSPEMLGKILDEADDIFGISADPEITVEANPDDISMEWLRGLKQTRVNRLSIGIQSFYDEDLKYLNRVHSGEEASNVIGRAREAGFENLSIDLIYGIPTLTDENWLGNLERAVKMNVPHISAYALTVEPGTALDVFIRKGKYLPVSDESAERHFKLMVDFLTKAGYMHYEISNFALPQMHARHNTSYWFGEKYLGIGPSAHSYDKISRQWNVSALVPYLDGISKGKPGFEREVLSENQQVNEFIMTRLRTMWGLDLDILKKLIAERDFSKFLQQLLVFEKQGKVKVVDGKVRLSDAGKFLADGIAASLFLDE